MKFVELLGNSYTKLSKSIHTCYVRKFLVLINKSNTTCEGFHIYIYELLLFKDQVKGKKEILQKTRKTRNCKHHIEKAKENQFTDETEVCKHI